MLRAFRKGPDAGAAIAICEPQCDVIAKTSHACDPL